MPKNDDARAHATRILHQAAYAAFHGQAPWPATRQTCEALHKTMVDAGLITEVEHGGFVGGPGVDDEFELLAYTIGYHDPWDFPSSDYASDDLRETMDRLAPDDIAALAEIKQAIFAAYASRYLPPGSRQ